MSSTYIDIEDCGPLPNIQNGRVELNPNTLENSTASYFCDEGYELIGDMSRTCQRQNAMWNGTEPICRSKSYSWLLSKKYTSQGSTSTVDRFCSLTTHSYEMAANTQLAGCNQVRGITLALTDILSQSQCLPEIQAKN